MYYVEDPALEEDELTCAYGHPIDGQHPLDGVQRALAHPRYHQAQPQVHGIVRYRDSGEAYDTEELQTHPDFGHQ